MNFDFENFMESLKRNLDSFATKEVTTQCENFVLYLYHTDEAISLKKAEKILQWLRGKRMFQTMEKVADALIQTGRITYKIQRQYAQALIDLGNYSAGTFVLERLISNTQTAFLSDSSAQIECIEAKGLLGRIYKQLYVNINNPSNPQCIHFLNLAVKSYFEVYSSDASKIWHGINVVALSERAKRDRVSLAVKVDSLQLAREILTTVEKKDENGTSDAWDYATAAEACLALDKLPDALRWLSGYARNPYCDAFELASTLRQLEEVWELDIQDQSGIYLLPILRAELASRSGSVLTLDMKEIKKQADSEEEIDKLYRGVEQNQAAKRDRGMLEKVFGQDSFNTYKWYMKGASRCEMVARIGTETAKGDGTGFLFKGSDLCENLGEAFFLITNEHVVSPSMDSNALFPDEIVVIFEAVNANEVFSGLELIWSSPRNDLDATILKFSTEDQSRIQKMFENKELYKPHPRLPALNSQPRQKILVIGHPYGGTLQISFQDNYLLDHDNNSKIHYRTPTDGGSSGSPVFNQQWDLIGLHHAGSAQMPRLNGLEGTYEANEGIWIQAISKKLKAELTV